MAIVEDEVRNDSEEENEIEVVVEEDDADQDTDDSEDDDDEDVLERKVADLERKVIEDPYNYEDHIELIQALWSLTELDRWRAAYDRLYQLSPLRPEHWLMRIQTEESLSHSDEERELIAALFKQASLDCYSIPILSEWCTWSISGDVSSSRAQLDEVLRRAGADPLSGKLFHDAKLELEKAQLEALSEDHPDFKKQQERVLWCLEDIATRPMLRNEEAWQPLQELALSMHGQSYVDKLKKRHDAAVEFLHKITPLEDKLLTMDNIEEKLKIYQEYIDTVKELSRDDKYSECEANGIIRVLYDRATTECLPSEGAKSMLVSFAYHCLRQGSSSTRDRVLQLCTRRCSNRALFYCLHMQQQEKQGLNDAVKTTFETALSKGMESYKETEKLWLGYLEFIRRSTQFDNEDQVDRLRRTFRLAWDSLAEAWGEEANDCEVPLFWARIEYKRVKDPKRGKEIFEEIFKYGENKSMSKYWEAFIQLESTRDPPPSEHKLRDLHRRALKFVSDYPPSAARLWTDFERDFGQLDTVQECYQLCEEKLKEWRDNYQAMKEKMIGKKAKGKQNDKKNKPDKRKDKKDEPKNKGKRKSDEVPGGSGVKRKKDGDMEMDVSERDSDGAGVKRSHDDGDNKEIETKRQRTDSGSKENLTGREACTLFVSNLEFKVDEQHLRDSLSKFGDIVSMRVRAGVKAFGGSICYCQYKTSESVDKAIKHDRTPLDGRPMFLSRYSAKKTTPSFKYSVTVEKNKLFVKNIPFESCSKEQLQKIFDKYGDLVDVRIVTRKDGKPKGLAYIEYKDAASASNALEKTNGLLVGDRNMEVAISAPPTKTDAASLGQPKRDGSGGMRRTQVSFIPSVLQKASTSKSANGNQSNGDEKKSLSNSDFRSLLAKKSV